MKTPDWWQFLILALAVFRFYRLIAEDTILDRPRRWLLRLDANWQKEGDYTGERYRSEWALFITCPWCLGFHVSWILWLFWLWSPSWTTGLCIPFALSAVVGLTAKNLDRDE